MLQRIQQAVGRQLPPQGSRAGVNLSGGLDSRMLLGALGTQLNPGSLRTYTFGQEGCDDKRLAQQLAQIVGTQHQSLSLPADYLLEYAPIGVRLTDGMDSCIHIHSVANVDRQASEVDFLYTGFYVDSITNPAGTREWLVRIDDDTALNLHYEYMHRLFPRDPAEEIFTPEFLGATRDEFDASFRQTVNEFKGDTMFTWVEGVEITQRQRRLIQCGNDLVRWQVECRTPFTDTDFVDFCVALPPAHRLERYLFTDVFVRNYPKLAKVPNDRTGMPFVVDFRYLSQQAKHNMRFWLFQRGIGERPQYRRKLLSQYDVWFRTALRPWVEETLLDTRSLQRGIIQPAALQRTLNEHMTGAVNRTREIGMLLSIELWHRAYMP
jgi:asparagine synthase (glutamine-hydrolysing)